MVLGPGNGGGRRRPQVLVLGGGFGGIGAARKLKHADVEVVLVDANDYQSFQPMLYQLATGLVETAAVAHSLRDLFRDQRNATVHQARVAAVDLDRREVQFEDMTPLPYDYLVVALGGRVQFFGVEGAAEHAFPLYGVGDAVRLKDHIVRTWEEADRDPALRRTRRRQADEAVRLRRQGDDGCDRPRLGGRPAARRPHDQGQVRAWGAVHLALLSSGEDRAKAMVDWTWAGFTHRRAGRIRVESAAAH